MSGFGGFGQNQPGSSFTYGGKPAATATPLFSTGNTSGGTVQFGTPQTSAPTGISFGTPSFGAATSTPFGASTTTPSFAFGAPKTTAATVPAMGFGTPSATGGFNLGGVPSSSTPGFPLGATAPTGLTFGQPPTAAPSTGLTFGTPKTTGGLSFGLPTTSTAAAPAPNFGFNTTTPATAAPAFGYTTAPVPTTSSTFGFNTGTTTTSAGLGFNASTSSAAPSFGLPTTTTTPSLPSFNFGTSSVQSSLGSSLFGAKTTGSVSLTTATTTTSVGLGGVDNSLIKRGLTGAGTSEPKAPKDNPLPEPLMQTLTDFQNFTKLQKSISVEISHGGSKNLKKVQEDTDALKSLLANINNGLTRNTIAVDRLKTETAKALHQAEMAQRIHEMPPGLSYDNYSSAEYFNVLVSRFEEEAARLNVQIENSEKHLRSLEQSSTLSPQELTRAMKHLHETLVVLAGQAQSLHTNVLTQKEQYRGLRRIYFKDDIDPIPSTRLETKKTYLRSLTGPTPFSDTPVAQHFNILSNTSLNPSGWISTSPPTTSLTSSFLSPPTNVLATPQPTENSVFQLSKPPPGNKRNKR